MKNKAEPPETERTYNIIVSYCMVCAYVQEDNPRTLACGLSPVYTHNHTITLIVPEPPETERTYNKVQYKCKLLYGLRLCTGR